MDRKFLAEQLRQNRLLGEIFDGLHEEYVDRLLTCDRRNADMMHFIRAEIDALDAVRGDVESAITGSKPQD
jgi:hypothetical protein